MNFENRDLKGQQSRRPSVAAQRNTRRQTRRWRERSPNCRRRLQVEPLEQRLVLSGVNYESLILGDDPAGYWRFDETSGTLAESEANSPAHDGTYQNDVGLNDAGLPGLGGISASFDGINDHVTIP